MVGRFLLILLTWRSSTANFTVIHVTNPSEDLSLGPFRGMSALFGPRLGKKQNAAEYTVQVPENLLKDRAPECLPGETESVQGASTAMMYSRGPKGQNCTFSAKAKDAEGRGAALALIVNYDSSLSQMSGPKDFEPKIPTVMITHELGSKIIKESQKGHRVNLKMWFYERRMWDFSMFIMGCLATFCVYLGAVVSARVEEEQATGKRSPTSPEPQEQVEITLDMAYSFILVASTALVFMYFFVDIIVYPMMLGFVLAGANAIAILFSPYFNQINPCLSKKRRVPGFGNFKNGYLTVLGLSYCMGGVWFVYRKSPHAYIIQNIISISLLLNIQLTIQLNSIKVSTVLLTLAFFYDIFMVFVTPYITKGTSVMEHVALGGKTGELMPMLLAVPHLQDDFEGFARLGLGDIALPGVLVAYLLRFDRAKGLYGFKGFFAPALVAYATGMAITFAALVAMKKGQPALLWLVPTTLGTTLILSHSRGTLKEMWEGHSDDVAEGSTIDTETVQLIPDKRN